MSKMRTVKVVRSFYWNGAATEVGAVIEVPFVFAAELIAAKKAVAHEAAPPPAAKPEEGEANKKESRHAR